MLIKGFDPFEAYLCNEGLARFCTEDYTKPTRENRKKLCKHLTNFSLNKKSDKFVEAESKPQNHSDPYFEQNFMMTQTQARDL